MQKDNEKIIIHADPEIANLIPGYIENRKRDILKLREALDKGDYEAIGYLGHNMKGSGEAYGFSAISDIGAALERAAMQNNKDKIKRRIDELEDYVGRVEVVYG